MISSGPTTNGLAIDLVLDRRYTPKVWMMVGHPRLVSWGI